MMTIQKKLMKEFEELDPLTSKDFVKDSLETEIMDAPRVVKTKFADDQVVINVKVGIEKKVWWANWTSMNALIDKMGNDETKMAGKQIQLVLVKQPVQGKMKKVIYLAGSLKEDEE